jgi:hypothetical protein
MNITTKTNGFIFNGIDYEFSERHSAEILSGNQVHIPTKSGVLLLDLSCKINEVEYTDINLFTEAIKGE